MNLIHFMSTIKKKILFFFIFFKRKMLGYPTNRNRPFYKLAQKYANNQLWYQRKGYTAKGVAKNAAVLTAAVVANKFLRNKADNKKMSARPSRNPSRKRYNKKPENKCTRVLKSQVKDIKKCLSSNQGTLIYRLRGTSRCVCAVNSITHAQFASNQMANYETVLGELRFFDIDTPGTLIQASGASGTYYREYLFKSVYSHYQCVNNYQVPCKVTLYLCRPKEDTSISPTTAFTDGLTDVGNPSSSSPLIHITDSDEFTDLWKIDKSQSKVLMPGQKLDMFTSDKNVLYSPATFDSHNLPYQKRFHCWAYVIRVEGVLGHDTTADEQGFLAGGVDMSCDQIYTVSYDAGIDLKYIVLSNSSDTFTNGGVISSKPVSDNIGYSIA